MRLKKESPENKNKIPYEVTSGFDLPTDWNPETDAAVMVRGCVFFINREDLEFVCSRRFYINPSGYMDFNKDGEKVLYHRLVMNAPRGMIVDHINRDRRDNRKRNIRIKHNSHNQANKNGKNPIGFRGLMFKRGAWEANIGFNNERIYLGRFESREDAARAYDRKAVECFGDCAVTNFPIQEYAIPEKCLADNLPPTVIVRQNAPGPCPWPSCKQTIMVGSEYCFRHTRVIKKREEKKKAGKRLRVIAPHASEYCTHSDHGAEKVEAIHIGLCRLHYRKTREQEGYVKPKKHYSCEVIENGKLCGKVAIKIKERLCSTHYKSKYGLFKKMGAPKGESAPCKVCGEQGSKKTGLCKKHYLEQWRNKNANS
jgi:hypothetical protein